MCGFIYIQRATGPRTRLWRARASASLTLSIVPSGKCLAEPRMPRSKDTRLCVRPGLPKDRRTATMRHPDRAACLVWNGLCRSAHPHVQTQYSHVICSTSNFAESDCCGRPSILPILFVDPLPCSISSILACPSVSLCTMSGRRHRSSRRTRTPSNPLLTWDNGEVVDNTVQGESTTAVPR